MTFTLSAPVVATEGALYSFDITPTAALADATMIRWQIVPKGALPVTSSDFPSLTGMLSFTSGATTAQTVTFIPTDDARQEISKDFELRIYDTADDSTPLDTQVVTLRDNDDATGTYGNDILTGNGDANIIGFGTTHAVTANGSAGDDFYVISRFQYGNVEITDTVGTNLVKFDAGVTITDYDEESADGFVKVISRVDLTLSTGAVVTIINPVGKFVFQLGSDPIITTYDEFKGEIRAEGSNETSTLRNNEAFQVLTATTDPDISGNSLSAQFSPSFGSANVDVFSSASTFGFSQNGSAGDDFYVISRFQYGNVEITDTVGTNLIKFDVGVTITDYDEESADGFVKVISRVDLTLSTGAVITIINPVGKFVFQLGDDDVIATYAEFKGEIRAEGSNETSTLRNNEAFSIPFPSTDAPTPSAGNDAVFDDVPTDFTLFAAQDGSTAAIIIGSVTASDADGDTITYSLGADSADEDATDFAIDGNGQITYVGTGLTSGSTAMFDVIATSTGADNTRTAIRQSVTIDIVENTAPLITQGKTIVEDFTGHTNLYVNGADADDGLFHYSGSIDGKIVTSSDSSTGANIDTHTVTISDDAVAYLPDGSTVTIPSGRFDLTLVNPGFILSYLWLTQAADGTWELGSFSVRPPATAQFPFLPPAGTAYYILGIYVSGVFDYPHRGNYPHQSGEFVTDERLVIEHDSFTVESAENDQAITTFTAVDDTPNGLAWTLTGDDSDLFTINRATGEVRWANRPDYEVTESDAESKVFSLTATATDNLGEANSLKFQVILTDVNEGAPVIDQADGTVIMAPENQLAVTTLSATDIDMLGTLTWSLMDASGLFAINEETGAITWVDEPNYEDPSSYGNDADRDFSVTAQVTDGVNTDSIAFTIRLANVNEAPVISLPAGLETTNAALTADVETSVSAYRGGADATADLHIDALTDGNTGLPDEDTGITTAIMWGGGADITSYNARHTGGQTLTFTLDDDYTQGRVEVYTRATPNGRGEGHIHNTMVQFRLDGENVGDPITIESTENLAAETLIAQFTVTPPAGLVFDEVLFTFPSNSDGSEANQQIAEVEIFGASTTDIAVDSDEGQDAVIDLGATDVDFGDSQTWVLSGADMDSFEISDSGEITWNSDNPLPNFDTTVSVDTVNPKVFHVTATVEDAGELMDTIDLTVTLVDIP